MFVEVGCSQARGKQRRVEITPGGSPFYNTSSHHETSRRVTTPQPKLPHGSIMLLKTRLYIVSSSDQYLKKNPFTMNVMSLHNRPIRTSWPAIAVVRAILVTCLLLLLPSSTSAFAATNGARRKYIPTIEQWQHNDNGSITGYVVGSPDFPDGTRITTSAARFRVKTTGTRMKAEKGSKIRTSSGGRYKLGMPQNASVSQMSPDVSGGLGLNPPNPFGEAFPESTFPPGGNNLQTSPSAANNPMSWRRSTTLMPDSPFSGTRSEPFSPITDVGPPNRQAYSGTTNSMSNSNPVGGFSSSTTRSPRRSPGDDFFFAKPGPSTSGIGGSGQNDFSSFSTRNSNGPNGMSSNPSSFPGATPTPGSGGFSSQMQFSRKSTLDNGSGFSTGMTSETLAPGQPVPFSPFDGRGTPNPSLGGPGVSGSSTFGSAPKQFSQFGGGGGRDDGPFFPMPENGSTPLTPQFGGDVINQQAQPPFGGASKIPGPTNNNSYGSRKYEPSPSNIFKTTEEMVNIRQQHVQESYGSSGFGREEMTSEGRWGGDVRDSSFYNR